MGGIFCATLPLWRRSRLPPAACGQNANAPSYRDHLAGGGIITGTPERGFAAGHLKRRLCTYCTHAGSCPCKPETAPAFPSSLPALGQLHRELCPAVSPAPAHRTSRHPVRCSSCYADPCGAEHLAFCGCAAAGCRSASSSGAAPPRSGSARAAGW